MEDQPSRPADACRPRLKFTHTPFRKARMNTPDPTPESNADIVAVNLVMTAMVGEVNFLAASIHRRSKTVTNTP